jgi:hypothetical protein
MAETEPDLSDIGLDPSSINPHSWGCVTALPISKHGTQLPLAEGPHPQSVVVGILSASHVRMHILKSEVHIILKVQG